MNSTAESAHSDFESFGLNHDPFAPCEDDAFFFASAQHKRALDFMGSSLWTRMRLGVISAQTGCGKSLVISRFVRDLDDRVLVAAVSRENISAREFLLEILGQFGFPLNFDDKTDRRRVAERFLIHQASMGRLCLLIVENAQNMHPFVLEELRYLATVESEGVRVLKVLLLGNSTLNRVLDSSRMAELVSTPVARCSIEPFSEAQTAAYVAHRLRAAGATNPDALMPSVLISQVYACTAGVPAQINELCARALANARVAKSAVVTSEALEAAIDALGWRDRALPPLAPQELSPAIEIEVDLELPPEGPVFESKLIVSMQGSPDREVALNGARMLIGRGDDADVPIDSVFVSRYHALILRDSKQDVLLDLGSTNGLLVNSLRIVRRGLRDRDLIQIGPTRLTYRTTLPAATANAPVDPSETICFARPGFPVEADEDTTSIFGFGRSDTPSNN